MVCFGKRVIPTCLICLIHPKRNSGERGLVHTGTSIMQAGYIHINKKMKNT